MLTQPHLRRTSGGPKSHYRENKILYYNQSAIKRQDAGGQILQDAEQAWWGNQMLDLWCSGVLFFSTKSFERRLERFYICSCPAQMVLEIACVNLSQYWSRGHRFHTSWPHLQGWGANLAWLGRPQPGLGFKQPWCHEGNAQLAMWSPCGYSGLDSGTGKSETGKLSAPGMVLTWNTMGLICLGSCHGLSPTCGSPLPCWCTFPTESPVSTRQGAEELTAVEEGSRITDMWQVKLLEENPSDIAVLRWIQSHSQGETILQCLLKLCCCAGPALPASKSSSALSLPSLWPCVILCTGRVTAGQNPTQKFLNSRLSSQQCPTTPVGASAVLVLLTVLGCSTPQLDLLQDCKKGDKN